MNAVTKLVAIVPTVNEVESLRQTVAALLQIAPSQLAEVIVVVAPHATTACQQQAWQLTQQFPQRVRVVQQPGRGLGDAFQRGWAGAVASHVLLMFSDLESDPALAPAMVDLAHQYPDQIISASRWLPSGSFEGYSRGKWLLNLLAQRLIAVVSRSSLTDFTFGYRVVPLRCWEGWQFRESGHGFVLESLLVALARQTKVQEVATCWRRRHEGTAAGTLQVYLPYLGILWRFFRPSWSLVSGPSGVRAISVSSAGSATSK